MAAHSYFGKSAQDLTIAEGAMLAGLLKGPSFFNPDRHPDRAKERLSQVDPLIGGAVALAAVSVTCYLVWRKLRKK
jgi:hypothetical protein